MLMHKISIEKMNADRAFTEGLKKAAVTAAAVITGIIVLSIIKGF